MEKETVRMIMYITVAFLVIAALLAYFYLQADKIVRIIVG